MLRPSRALCSLAAGVPFVVYLLTAGASSYWLDAGELAAVSVGLDIAHPPGHPLTALYGKAVSLLPLGPLPFRIALGQALAAALACGLLYRAALRAVSMLMELGAAQAPETPEPQVSAQRAAVAHAAAALAPVTWGLSFAVWMQAVRPEVYALQALLLVLVLERLIELHANGYRDLRPLYVATFALALGLCNHHAMSVLAMPALLHAVVRVTMHRSQTHAGLRRLRPWLTCTGLGLLALLPYVYLPLRALSAPLSNPGDPRTLERLLWVVSARVYSRGIGSEALEPIAERFTSALLVALDVTTAYGLPLCVLGIYAALRMGATRALAVTLGCLVITSLGVSPLLNSPTGNPDGMGYMVAGLAALAIFGCLGVATLCAVAMSAAGSRARLLAAGVALAAIAAGAEHVVRNLPSTDLSLFLATDVLDAARYRTLPPRTVLVLTTPQSVFRHLEVSEIDAARPDITLLALPFLGYPGGADALARRAPFLRDAADAFVRRGELVPEPLLRLAAVRPVAVELDGHVPQALYANLMPLTGYYAVVDARRARELAPRALAARTRSHARVDALLASQAQEKETARQLLWTRYMDALHDAGTGQLDAARASLEAALALGPGDLQLQALLQALDRVSPGTSLEVAPFLGPHAPLL